MRSCQATQTLSSNIWTSNLRSRLRWGRWQQQSDPGLRWPQHQQQQHGDSRRVRHRPRAGGHTPLRGCQPRGRGSLTSPPWRSLTTIILMEDQGEMTRSCSREPRDRAEVTATMITTSLIAFIPLRSLTISTVSLIINILNTPAIPLTIVANKTCPPQPSPPPPVLLLTTTCEMTGQQQSHSSH